MFSRVAATRAALVPWAWGINGCASVLSAVLAILLAMSLGFNAFVVIAIALYVVAASGGPPRAPDEHVTKLTGKAHRPGVYQCNE